MRKLLALFVVILSFLLIGNTAVQAQVNANYWRLSTGTLRPNLGTWSLTVPQLGGSGTNCVHVDNTGLFSVTGTDCGAAGNVGNWFTPSTFGTSASNATSTLIGFTQGLYSLASSTIGNGTQVGGLTISGGATTTGNMYFSGNVYIAPNTTTPLNFAGNLTLGGQNGNFYVESKFGATSYQIYSSGLILVDKFQFDNGGLSIGSTFTGQNSPTGGLIVQGTTGIGTSSPFAKLSVHANNLDTNTTLFAIGSSTASATTTLFSVSNTGLTQGLNAMFLGTSTIGDGTQAGGLTISGGATTTGNAYFASKIGIGIQAPTGILNVNGGEAWFTGQTSDATNASGLKIMGGTNGGKIYARGDNAGGDDNLILSWGDVLHLQSNYGSTEVLTAVKAGQVGVGTTSPFAKLSVHANALDTNQTLFAIASSTATATTTLFTVDNKGQHVQGGVLPTVATSTGSGSGSVPAVIFGTPNFFKFDLTTGSTPAGSNAVIATFTLPSACPHYPVPVFTDADPDTAGLSGTTHLFASSTGASTFNLYANNTGLAATTDYQWNVYVGCY